MYFALQYIGEQQGVEYHYKLCVRSEENRREINIWELCNANPNERDIFKNGKSIMILLKTFSTFAANDGKVSFDLQICKTSSKTNLRRKYKEIEDVTVVH